MINIFSLLDALKLGSKGIYKIINKDLLVVSFEVTLSCVCNCQHCDLGGPKKEEKSMKPEDYAKVVRDLKPLFVQISGGEPLLRKDIVEIIKAVKQFERLPYAILVSNAALLNEKKYLELKKAGVNQFSFSLDFPDKRHDDFRNYPGLFSHLENLMPQLAKYGFSDIIMNTAITKANYKEIIPIAKKAQEWGVMISYSAYTPLRTGNYDLSFKKEDIPELKEKIEELIELKKEARNIVTSEGVLREILQFFETGFMPGCQAGTRFVVVMPDGAFVPCSMVRERYDTLPELQEKFVPQNKCGGCYVSIRCNSERNLAKQLEDLPSYINTIGNLLIKGNTTQKSN